MHTSDFWTTSLLKGICLEASCQSFVQKQQDEKMTNQVDRTAMKLVRQLNLGEICKSPFFHGLKNLLRSPKIMSTDSRPSIHSKRRLHEKQSGKTPGKLDMIFLP